MSFKFINCILNSCSFASLPIGSSSRTGRNVRERDKMLANETKCSRTGSVRGWDGTYTLLIPQGGLFPHGYTLLVPPGVRFPHGSTSVVPPGELFFPQATFFCSSRRSPSARVHLAYSPGWRFPHGYALLILPGGRFLPVPPRDG